jgi:hypothetical protein
LSDFEIAEKPLALLDSIESKHREVHISWKVLAAVLEAPEMRTRRGEIHTKRLSWMHITGHHLYDWLLVELKTGNTHLSAEK